MERLSESLITTQEAASMLAIKPGTLATWRSEGRSPIPFVRIGGRVVRYRLSDIQAYIEGHGVVAGDVA
ncbi:MAG: helix-turn-helix domain-containing protein [bacterium]|nr:helix-turn-helix domain-containing protein [bacterium]